VREIFISKQRNRNGWRFGFARFKGVVDEHRLARQLDQIIIAGLKLYVNVPKYGREKTRKTAAHSEPHRIEGKQQNGTWHGEHYQPAKGSTSYAEVVARDRNNAGQMKIVPKLDQKWAESRSTILLDIHSNDNQWLSNAWVGRLKNLRWFDRLEEDPTWDFGAEITLKYMGDDMVLLIGLTDTTAKRMKKETTEEEVMFYSLEKWQPSLRATHRLTWVQCWGIPLVVWDKKYFRQIVAAIGDMIDVDDDTEESRRLDRVRILICTPRCPAIHHTVCINVGGDTYNVSIVEEVSRGREMCDCRRRRISWSSEEIDYLVKANSSLTTWLKHTHQE